MLAGDWIGATQVFSIPYEHTSIDKPALGLSVVVSPYRPLSLISGTANSISQVSAVILFWDALARRSLAGVPPNSGITKLHAMAQMRGKDRTILVSLPVSLRLCDAA